MRDVTTADPGRFPVELGWSAHALSLALLVCLALAGFLLPSTASACEPTTVCLVWEAEFIDSGVGEDYLVPYEKVPATGARITLIPPPPELPISTALNEEGCVTFETQFSYGHKAIVYADAVVAGVRLRPAVTTYNTPPAEYPVYLWEVHMNGLAPGGIAFGGISNEAAIEEGDVLVRVLPMMAAATAVLRRFDELNVMPPALAADETLTLAYVPSFGNARCACDGGSQSRLEFGPDSFQEKFLIGHELGHWLQGRWSTVGTGARNYRYPEPVDVNPDGSAPALEEPCQFDVIEPMLDIDLGPMMEKTDAGFHGMRSAEWSGGGLVEGFAHFVAGLVFNDPAQETGVFRYYKDIAGNNYDSFLAAGSRVALEGGDAANTLGGASRWVELQCPDDWAFGPSNDEVTSGIDWMRFWWRFLTDQPAAQGLTPPAIFGFVAEVQNDANYDWSEAEVWPQLSAAASQQAFGISAHSARFNTIADEEGVDNDQ